MNTDLLPESKGHFWPLVEGFAQAAAASFSGAESFSFLWFLVVFFEQSTHHGGEI